MRAIIRLILEPRSFHCLLGKIEAISAGRRVLCVGFLAKGMYILYGELSNDEESSA